MTTYAQPPTLPTPPTAAADSWGSALVDETARVLAELMVIGLLEHADYPAQLPGLLLPDLAPGPDRDRAMFLLGAVVGAAAGRRHTRASQASIASARTAMNEAGFEAMGAVLASGRTRRPWSAP